MSNNLIMAFPLYYGFYVELRPISDKSESWEVRILGERFGWIDRLDDGNYRWTGEDLSRIDFHRLDDAVTSTWLNWCQAYVVTHLRGEEYKDPPCPF